MTQSTSYFVQWAVGNVCATNSHRCRNRGKCTRHELKRAKIEVQRNGHRLHCKPRLPQNIFLVCIGWPTLRLRNVSCNYRTWVKCNWFQSWRDLFVFAVLRCAMLMLNIHPSICVVVALVDSILFCTMARTQKVSAMKQIFICVSAIFKFRIYF